MKKHSDSIVLASGLPANGATVTIYEAGTANLASIYSTALGTALSNPITADSSGYFEFYAVDGVYTVAVSGLGYQTNTSTVVLFTDPADSADTTATFTNKTFDLSHNTLTGTIAQFNAACSDADFVTGSGTSTGTNTGDNAVNSLYSGLVSNATHTGDATGSTALTVVGINGQNIAALATGILKNTTGTGVPSIAAAGTDYQAPIGTISGLVKGNGANALTAAVAGTDYLTPSGSAASLTSFPTLNQDTTGYASALKSATTTVGVSAATAPSSGQVLTATSSTAATWQTPYTVDLASPGSIGGTTPSTGAFTTISATGAVTGSTTAKFGTGTWAAGAVHAYANSTSGASVVCDTSDTTAPTLIFRNDPVGGAIIKTSTGNPLLFQTSGTERARISSTGLAVTGTLSATSSGSFTAPVDAVALRLGARASDDVYCWQYFMNNAKTVTYGGVLFDSNKQLSVMCDDTYVLTARKGTSLALQGATTATGTGITFPATQSASSDVNTLDDYEEGNWTPGISFGGATTGITYSAQTGTYTKIGNVVTVTGQFLLTSKGSATGVANLTGLPFSSVLSNGFGNGGFILTYYANCSGFNAPIILIGPVSTAIPMYFYTSTDYYTTSVTQANFTNTSVIGFSGTYKVS